VGRPHFLKELPRSPHARLVAAAAAPRGMAIGQMPGAAQRAWWMKLRFQLFERSAK
jgi:hypothetical protein